MGSGWRAIRSSDSAIVSRCGWRHPACTSAELHSPRPQTKPQLLDALRAALVRAPQPKPEIAGVPLLGGLVGYTAYDAVRYFERMPGRSLDDTETPHAHYVAPCSLLVFDHLTRSVALLHDGSEAERQSLRREVE